MIKTNIWQLVKDLESKTSDKEQELGEARATMLVNYGEEGKCVKGLCDSKDTLTGMILKVFAYYYTEMRKVYELMEEGK